MTRARRLPPLRLRRPFSPPKDETMRNENSPSLAVDVDPLQAVLQDPTDWAALLQQLDDQEPLRALLATLDNDPEVLAAFLDVLNGGPKAGDLKHRHWL